jgi:hypothetical protein
MSCPDGLDSPGILATVERSTYPFARLDGPGRLPRLYVVFGTLVVLVSPTLFQSFYRAPVVPVLVPSGDVVWLAADCVRIVS